MKVRRLNYLIELTYDKSFRGYVADVVSLYGCMSQGKTKEEALKNAEKAIKAYMEALAKPKTGAQIIYRSVDTLVPMAYA